jgi:hypothetical protein
VPARDIAALPILSRVERAKEEIGDGEIERFGELQTGLEAAFSGLIERAESVLGEAG